MGIGELGYLISKWAVYLFLLIASLYGSYAVYYAYIKTKDERQKYIVLRSTAHAFSVTLIFLAAYYIIQISVDVANVEQLTRLWDLLHFEMEGPTTGSTASGMMAVLGICLFINKRKAGGD